tara:strand:+ start:5838 stop:6266 length:429 start_codon:yes stop_codon:yes gene_type:complete
MKKVLFVCTANIHRSRFAEEVFNFFCTKHNKDYHAFSAGLRVGDYSYRKIYFPALENLKVFNIIPKRPNDLSKHIKDVNLENYDKIICMDEDEHKPMVNSDPKLSNYNFEYWNITDMPKVDSNVSLPICYKKVENLLNEMSS